MAFTPEQFSKFLAGDITPGLIAAVEAVIRTALKEAPAKTYEVIRQTPTGPVKVQIGLTQIMNDLTEQLKVSSGVQAHLANQNSLLVQSNNALILELKEHRRFAKKLARQREDEGDA